MRKIFPSALVMKPLNNNPQESEQLSEAIKAVGAHSGEETIIFQDLEQRLQIASPQVISEALTKLVYLFKLLINRRDKIPYGSLALDANIQLSKVIIQAMHRAQIGASKESWKQLEAMEKLLRAREYHKKGLR